MSRIGIKMATVTILVFLSQSNMIIADLGLGLQASSAFPSVATPAMVSNPRTYFNASGPLETFEPSTVPFVNAPISLQSYYLPLIMRSNSGRVYYVATTGDDLTGTGTAVNPWRTIMRAVRQAQSADTILVRAGTYNEEVVFDHGGIAGKPITLRNFPGEVAILDGSMDVIGWTQIAGTDVWRANFTHLQGISTKGDFEDVAEVSTCPDSYKYSGDRRAYLYVDNTPDSSHWLKPVCIIGSSPEYTPASIPAGAFATDVPPPPLPTGQRYSGSINTIYVHLIDNSSPNNHRIRIPAFKWGIKLRGDGAVQVSYVNIIGLGLRLAQSSILVSSEHLFVTGNINLEQLDMSLNKGATVETYYCSTNVSLKNSHIHDIENEGIHLESDSSVVDNNVIEHTIAPWSVWGSIGINVLGINNRISRNTIHDIYATQGGRGGFGVFMEEWYNGTGDVGCHSETNQNNVIEKNRIYDNRAGIYNSGGDYNAIQNNVVFRNKSTGIALDIGGLGGGPSGSQRDAVNNNIYFNTIYGNLDIGIGVSAGATGTIIRNNIAYQNANWNLYIAIGTKVTQDHNLMTDPLFVDAANGNFHLRANSTAIGVAIDTGVIDDFDGIPRPQGTSYDIGAFQYVGQTAGRYLLDIAWEPCPSPD